MKMRMKLRWWKSFSFHTAIGLLLASSLIASLGYFTVSSIESHRLRQHAERGAMMGAHTMARIVGNIVASGKATSHADQLNALVDEWSLRHFEASSIRIIEQSGKRLLSSSNPLDMELGVPPRKLHKDEKWLYDLGNELRTGYDFNLSKGIPTTHEIEYLPDGLVRISFPFFKNRGAKHKYVGFIQIESYLNLASSTLDWKPFAMLAICPFILFILFSQTPFFSRTINNKPATKFVAAPFVLGAILLTLAVSLYAIKSINNYSAEYRVLTLDMADNWFGQDQEVESLNESLGLNASVTPDENGLALLYVMQRAYSQRHSSVPDNIVDNYKQLGDKVIDEVEKADLRSVKKWLFLSVVGAIIIYTLFGTGYAAIGWNTFAKYRTAYFYVMPAMVGMSILVFFPVIYGITLSMTEQNIYNQSSDILDIWVGFRNYVTILSDFNIFKMTEDGPTTNYESFYWTFFITVLWTVCNVFIGVTVGMLLALILNTPNLKGKSFYRILLILPWAIPNYITALTWHGLFHQQFGAINQIVQMFGGEPIAWYDTVFTSFITGVAANGWLSFPFMMVVGLGALQSVDQDMYDSANLDGATRWQKFRYVTFPSIKPVMIPAIILSVIWTFNMFNVVFLVSGGQPAGSNEILITKAFKLAFHKFQYGYAAAYSTIIFAILIIYGIFQNRVSRASEGVQRI